MYNLKSATGAQFNTFIVRVNALVPDILDTLEVIEYTPGAENLTVTNCVLGTGVTVTPEVAEVLIVYVGIGTPVLVLVNVNAELLQTVEGILKLAVGEPQLKTFIICELVDGRPFTSVTLSDTV
jgi:hypothetical protein